MGPFADALACAALLTGLSLPAPDDPPIVYHGALTAAEAARCFELHRPYKNQSPDNLMMVRIDGRIVILGGCYGLTWQPRPGAPIDVWADPRDWLTLVHEGFHALRRVAKLPHGDDEERQARELEQRAHTCPGAVPAIRPPLTSRFSRPAHD